MMVFIVEYDYELKKPTFDSFHVFAKKYFSNIKLVNIAGRAKVMIKIEDVSFIK